MTKRMRKIRIVQPDQLNLDRLELTGSAKARFLPLVRRGAEAIDCSELARVHSELAGGLVLEQTGQATNTGPPPLLRLMRA